MNATVSAVTHSNFVCSVLEDTGKRSQTLLEKKGITGFLDKAEDSQEVVKLVEQLRTAIAYYQVSGNYVAWTRANAHGPALTATVDIQSDREAGCKSH